MAARVTPATLGAKLTGACRRNAHAAPRAISGKCLKERAHSGSFACRLSGDRIRDTPIRSAQCQKTGTSYGRAGTFASKRAVSAQAAAGLDEAQAEADTTISGGITPFLKDKTIFISGTTGFLGKLILEKILHEQPDVAKVYVIVSPRRGKSAAERLSAQATLSKSLSFIMRSGSLSAAAIIGCVWSTAQSAWRGIHGLRPFEDNGSPYFLRPSFALPSPLQPLLSCFTTCRVFMLLFTIERR
eukprot:1194821-Prorocentrum_minimum.AAC.6